MYSDLVLILRMSAREARYRMYVKVERKIERKRYFRLPGIPYVAIFESVRERPAGKVYVFGHKLL